ncbi:hypothetical protein F2Q70_00038697 [Brassica cretica]|uniref:Uncharacterized protein n=1 Tax=Brassica cretica TaxID=69181 RepID=A0A8S9KBB0_BRACR|nr:hypothetical protein F2Q70_00038697 [Brassica cretica]
MSVEFGRALSIDVAVYSSGGRMWLLDWNRVVMDMSVRHNWFVCRLHIAPTIDKKALPSNREEFQFRLISKTWKLTGTRVLQICTSSIRLRDGLQPPEHLSSDLLHYADDIPGHAGLLSHHVQESMSQPCVGVKIGHDGINV